MYNLAANYTRAKDRLDELDDLASGALKHAKLTQGEYDKYKKWVHELRKELTEYYVPHDEPKGSGHFVDDYGSRSLENMLSAIMTHRAILLTRLDPPIPDSPLVEERATESAVNVDWITQSQALKRLGEKVTRPLGVREPREAALRDQIIHAEKMGKLRTNDKGGRAKRYDSADVDKLILLYQDKYDRKDSRLSSKDFTKALSPTSKRP